MKLKDSVKIADQGWIRKRKGYRIHFQKREGAKIVTDYCPGEGEKLIDSDVVAWRLAWKLVQATATDGPEIGEGEIVNVYVVDDRDERIRYYATHAFEMLNPKDTGADTTA